MTTKLRYIMLGVVSFTLVFSLSRSTAGGDTAFAKNGPMRVPFTASLKKVMYTATGAQATIREKNYSRFSDGSFTLSVVETFPAQSFVDQEVVNLRTGDWIMLDPLTHSKSTLKHSPAELQSLVFRLDSQSCPEGVNLQLLPSAGNLMGFGVVSYHDNDNTVRAEDRLIVPSLSCFSFKTTQVDKSGARNEEVVTAFQAGEPEASLLEPTSDFVERAPDVVEKMHKVSSGGNARFGVGLVDQLNRKYKTPTF